jgi:hypothetical protein
VAATLREHGNNPTFIVMMDVESGEVLKIKEY